MNTQDRDGAILQAGDRVTVVGGDSVKAMHYGSHGIIVSFGNRYARVRLTGSDDDHFITAEPYDLRGGWHGEPGFADGISSNLRRYTTTMLCLAVDDGLITVEQGRAIVSHLREYSTRSSFRSPTLQSGALGSSEPDPVPVRD